MGIILRTAAGRELRKMKRIYLESFPKAERKPFGMMKQKARQGVMELLSIMDGRQLAGLAITVLYKDLVLLDYFAMSGKSRGGGRGSQALELIKERYKDRRMILEIELADGSLDSQDIRVRRKNFYLKNGMRQTGMQVCLFGVPMELLAFGEEYTYEEYHKLYEYAIGPFFARKVSLPKKEL